MDRKIKLGYVFLSLAVAAILSCSSDKKSDEGVSPDVAEATSDASAPTSDAAAAPGADGSAPVDTSGAPPPPGDATAATDPGAPPAPGDPGQAPETHEGEMASAGAPPAVPGAPGDVGTPPAPGDSAAPPPADGGLPAPTEAAAPPPSSDTPPSDSGASGQSGDLFGAGSTDAGASSGGDTPAPKKVGVSHIKDAPFTRGGQNLNTVYIAREGDTLDSISQKLFGEDRTKDLKKANPSAKKGVKTGDKVYFNSPNRPDDKEKMLTVYEDQGLEPSRYTTKEGDTLKSLAQEWYGSESSWKEIYGINKSLASTKELPAGTELTYWPATAAVAVYGAKKDGAEVAQNNPPAPPPGSVPPPDMGNNPPPGSVPPPPPPGPQANANPPGVAPGTVDNSAANLPPPPPPPDMNMAPPPPPTAPKKHRETASPISGMDKDMIMYVAAAGVFLIGGGLLIAIRRRNARRNSGITQV